LARAGAVQNREGQSTQTQIQYLGFQLKAHGRDYTYRVLNPKEGDREFTLSISNRAFAELHVPYQDAAGICYQKLQKALGLETPQEPLPRHSVLSDRELDEYLERHRPAKRRTY
jgi:hypothetical protein